MPLALAFVFLVTNLQALNLFGEEIPPYEDGAQKIRQRLWAKAHSMFVKNG
ncbi:MAG: hypothetical protein RMK94_15375 [Armatimonadota bacterium]|nr:hypothetical protein [Armatimonadota bacterium]